MSWTNSGKSQVFSSTSSQILTCIYPPPTLSVTDQKMFFYFCGGHLFAATLFHSVLPPWDVKIRFWSLCDIEYWYLKLCWINACYSQIQEVTTASWKCLNHFSSLPQCRNPMMITVHKRPSCTWGVFSVMHSCPHSHMHIHKQLKSPLVTVQSVSDSVF